MSNGVVFSNLELAQGQVDPTLGTRDVGVDFESSQTLAASITRAASKQTYFTVRFLVDRERISDAFRAYAYFRWLDDHLDQGAATRRERLTFVERQRAMMERCYLGEWPDGVTAEERMLVDLIWGGRGHHSGLQSYIRNMMAVMAFDTERRGRLVSQGELARYSRFLAVAVTEALHYFIGHDCASPQNETRYLAATGAHIAHMLRDTLEDASAGYYNVSSEFLESHGIGPQDVDSEPYRFWVESRVQAARACFRAGGGYLMQVENPRCYAAGYAYIARFESVLDIIEADGYRLRPSYSECKSLAAGMRMGWAVLSQSLAPRRPGTASRARLAE